MRVRWMCSTVLIACSAGVTGCYEESGVPAPAPAQNSAPQQPGPLTSVGQQPASSTLGKAKQTATNIADRAEQRSREVGDMADDIADPGGTSDRPPPSNEP